MKKANDEMRAEYDFSKGERGRYARRGVRIIGDVTEQRRANPQEPLHCPFCGSEELYKQSEQFPDATGYWIGCSACGGSGPLSPSPQAAIAAWNERFPC